MRVQTRELVQDINLHRCDLTKLICSVNKLLWNKTETRGLLKPEDALYQHPTFKKTFSKYLEIFEIAKCSKTKTKNQKRGVIKLLLCFFSKWARGLWAAALYVLYIQVFTVARWESPLPSGGPSQRKPNGFCRKREKSLLFTSQETFHQVRAVKPWLTHPVHGSIVQSPCTPLWLTARIYCGYMIFFFFLKTLFKDISWRRVTMERRTRSCPPCVCQDICRSRLSRAARTRMHVQDVSSSPG